MIKNAIQIGEKTICNRVVLQPMEGCDCNMDGSPSELTVEKYRRAARSGAGVIWFEANAVCPEGRTNPRQMMLTEENLPKFKEMLSEMRRISKEECGISPVFILQPTHSGRQSITPMIAYRNPVYEEKRPVTDENIVTDDNLDTLPEKFGNAARLAKEAAAKLSPMYAFYSGRMVKDTDEISVDKTFVADQDVTALCAAVRRIVAYNNALERAATTAFKPMISKPIIPVEIKIVSILKTVKLLPAIQSMAVCNLAVSRHF